MKKILLGLCSVLCLSLVLSGCAKHTKLPSDEEIVEEMSIYLENTVYQDASLYPSENDFIKANFGLTQEDVADVVLYMGQPNQNTTFFSIITKTENADSELILEKLEAKMQGLIETAEIGYIQGYTEYSIIEKDNKVFALMHEDVNSFMKMKEYINGL